jgi:hypothetical protein
VVVCAAGFGRPGFYTVAYDDDIDNKMLACFTPSGRGVCYYNNGNIRFLASTKGGHLAERDGSIERRWKWSPGGVKITTPVGFQVSLLHKVLYLDLRTGNTEGHNLVL